MRCRGLWPFYGSAQDKQTVSERFSYASLSCSRALSGPPGIVGNGLTSDGEEAIHTMLTPERKWWYRQRGNLTVEALRRNRFEAVFVENGAEAIAHILKIVPQGAVIGFGDSLTLREIGLFEALENHSCELVNPPAVQDHLSPEEKRPLRFGCFTSDVYFCSTNAITLDGKLVNIDGVGNRVAPTIFGPPRVVIVAGANKLVEDLGDALARIKREAAPLHAWRDGYKVPCGYTGVRNECKGPDRMCRVTVIHEGPTKQTEITVIIIGEDLGL